DPDFSFITDGASGSGLPPKKLRKDHGTSGINANTGGKFVAVLQSLLESSTLPVETQHPAERFIISSDSSHDINANATDDEVTSVIRSSMPPPPVLTAAIATTIAGTHLIRSLNQVSEKFDPTYLGILLLLAWSRQILLALLSLLLLAEFNVGTARQVALVEATEAARSSELDSFREQNTALEGQVMALESATISKDAELASSNAQIAKATHDLSNLQFSYDDLSVKASSLEFKKDKLIDQVSAMEPVRSLAEAPKAEQLQPSLDQLMLCIHQLEDQVVIGESSLYFSLDLAYASVQKLKENVASQRRTALSTTFVKAGSISPMTHAEAPPSSIVFEKEELDTMPEHTLPSAKLFALFCMAGLIAPVHEISRFEACVADLKVGIFFHFALLFASRIATCSLLSSKRSRLISKASSFCTMSTSDVLMVGMRISVGITDYVLYVSENGISPLLDLIMVWCALRTCGSSSNQPLLLSTCRAFIPSPKLLFALSTKPLACGYLTEAKHWNLTFPGFLVRSDKPASLDMLLSIFLHAHALPASSILSIWPLLPQILTPLITTYLPDLRRTTLAFSISAESVPSMRTCLVKWAKLLDAILHRASAFLFSLLGTCLIENFLKLLKSVFTFSRPALKPSTQDDQSMNSVHGSKSSSSVSMGVFRESSFGRSTMKSAKICPLSDVLGLYFRDDNNCVSLAWLTKYASTCFASLFVIKTALTASRADASVLNVSSMSHIISCSVRLLIAMSSTYTSMFLSICFWNALSTRCCLYSAMCHKTPVISAGFHANASRLHLKGCAPGLETIGHFSRIILLLQRVSTPHGTGILAFPELLIGLLESSSPLASL
nr:hypothetical protein [Tanacetum cinerariifolium]